MPNASASSCCRAGLLVGLVGLLVAGCAMVGWGDRDRWHERQADFYFRNFIGREPATAQERADGWACYFRAWAWGPTVVAQPRVPVNAVDAFFGAGILGAVSAVGAKKTEHYKACLRGRGYQLEAWELLPSGEWGQR